MIRADAAEQCLLRTAARRVALQSAGVLAVVVALAVAGLAFAFDRAQHGEIQRTVREAARTADDVDDPPPGVLLVEARAGTVTTTPGSPAGLGVLAGRPAGYAPFDLGRRHFTVYAAEVRDGRQFVAAYDLAGHARLQRRLVWSAVAAGVAGIALAAAVGLLIGRRAVRPLAEALALQRRFVTDASHELRTPLTVIQTRAQLLRRRLAGQVPDAQRHELDQLITDTSSLGDVVGDLLLSAQLQGDAIAGEPVDTGALAQSLVRSLRPYAEQTGTALDARVQDGAWVVAGAPAALRRAVGALVDNAIEHTHGGRVVVGVGGDARWVHVTVTDDGEGFDPAEHPRLTERFSRGGTTGGSPRRFGLGLALVDEVVRAHAGRLDIHAVPGEGARFTMVLPRARGGGARH
ncbi:MAG: sensor histidine kinase [Actinomycetales bacterium]